MTRNEIISQARSIDSTVAALLDACEAFYGHGVTDEVSGDVEAPTGHFYRVDRWIVTTDSQGFRELDEYETAELAAAVFAERDSTYRAWEAGGLV